MPLDGLGLFQTWNQAALATVTLAAVALGFVVGRETALAHPEEFWLYQKGVSLADWGLNRWLADVTIASAMILWWTLCWTAAATIHTHEISGGEVMAIMIWLLLVYLLATSLLFALGSGGTLRGTELAFVLFLVALLAPALVQGLPETGARIAGTVGMLLPPVHPAAAVRSGITAGEGFRVIAPSLIHVLTWISMMIGTGVWFLSRRRPSA